MCSKIWSVNCTFHYARSQLYQILTSRWNISIKIHQTHFKIAKLRCQLWKDSRSGRLSPLLKTHPHPPTPRPSPCSLLPVHLSLSSPFFHLRRFLSASLAEHRVTSLVNHLKLETGKPRAPARAPSPSPQPSPQPSPVCRPPCPPSPEILNIFNGKKSLIFSMGRNP